MLRTVADDGQAAAVGLQGKKNRRLESVGILIFIHEDVVKSPSDFVAQAGLADHIGPVQQQVVVVEHVLRLLLSDVRIKNSRYANRSQDRLLWSESDSSSPTSQAHAARGQEDLPNLPGRGC